MPSSPLIRNSDRASSEYVKIETFPGQYNVRWRGVAKRQYISMSFIDLFRSEYSLPRTETESFLLLFLVIGCTGICHFGSFQCISEWWYYHLSAHFWAALLLTNTKTCATMTVADVLAPNWCQVTSKHHADLPLKSHMNIITRCFYHAALNQLRAICINNNLYFMNVFQHQCI